jgi:predicted type IV restriction endonuclease
MELKGEHYMPQVPAKVAERLSAALKRFQPILTSANSRDVNESDTSIIVTDLLSDMFGYDKYSEVTREYAIRGTYCDLAIKIGNELNFLIEVKAIGLELKDAHIKQAVDYAANQGVDWVILTNGIVWHVFKVIFNKPIDHELILTFNLSESSARNSAHIELLYHLTREGLLKGALPAYQTQREATNKFFLSAIILSDTIIDALRRELRRLAPDVKIQPEEIRAALTNEVLKREVVEGEKAIEARKKAQKLIAKLDKAKKSKEQKAVVDKPDENAPVEKEIESSNTDLSQL